MKLSVVIVSFNTASLLHQCLNSLFRSLEAGGLADKSEVFVVDNGSNDESVSLVKKEFPKAKLILNQENKGYAAASNQAIERAGGEYILLLNSDTTLFNNTIKTMIDYMDKYPKAGVSTCRLELEDGSLDPACHRGFPTPWAAFTYFSGLEKLFPKSSLFARYHLGFLDLNTTHEIDSPSGAFYLLRRKVIEEVDKLDEDYFMYAEDLDWSYRIKKKGWKIMFVPATTAIHFKKRRGRESADVESQKKITAYFYETMKIFYRKHYGQKYPRLLMWLVFLVIELKKKLNLLHRFEPSPPRFLSIK